MLRAQPAFFDHQVMKHTTLYRIGARTIVTRSPPALKCTKTQSSKLMGSFLEAGAAC
jgi:hypothetical protein